MVSFYLSLSLSLLLFNSLAQLSFDKMFSFSIAFFHGIEWFWCKVVGWFVFFGFSESIAIANTIEMVQIYSHVSTNINPRTRERQREREIT